MCVCLSRCGCRVSAGAVAAEEQGESYEGSESKTLQYEARGGDQQTLQPAQNTGEISNMQRINTAILKQSWLSCFSQPLDLQYFLPIYLFSPRLAPEADRRRFGRITLPRTALQTTGLAWRCTMSRASSWARTYWRRWTPPYRTFPTRRLSWNCCLKTPRMDHEVWHYLKKTLATKQKRRFCYILNKVLTYDMFHHCFASRGLLIPHSAD